MSLQRIDQVEQALSRNIDFLDKDNFNKMVTLFLTQVQQIEDATLSIADQKNINTAIGVWLDYIGNIIGEPRKLRSDQDYRTALLLKIAINNSDGTPNNIIELTRQFSEALDSKIIEYFPAAFFSVISIPFDEENYSQSTLGLTDLVDNIKPAGTNATIVNNIDGSRFVPAGLIDNGEENVDFIVMSGGVAYTLELSNGDTLGVSVPAEYTVSNKNHSFLSWNFDTSYIVAFTEQFQFSGKIDYIVDSYNGEDQDITYNLEEIRNGDAGMLAQVVTN